MHKFITFCYLFAVRAKKSFFAHLNKSFIVLQLSRDIKKSNKQKIRLKEIMIKTLIVY